MSSGGQTRGTVCRTSRFTQTFSCSTRAFHVARRKSGRPERRLEVLVCGCSVAVALRFRTGLARRPAELAKLWVWCPLWLDPWHQGPLVGPSWLGLCRPFGSSVPMVCLFPASRFQPSTGSIVRPCCSQAQPFVGWYNGSSQISLLPSNQYFIIFQLVR